MPALFKFLCKKPLKIWLKTPYKAKSYHVFIFPKQILKSMGFSAKPPYLLLHPRSQAAACRRRGRRWPSPWPSIPAPPSRPVLPVRRPASRPPIASLSPPARAAAGREWAIAPGAPAVARHSPLAPLSPLSRPAPGGTASSLPRWHQPKCNECTSKVFQ